MNVRSPKNEHHPGKEARQVPLFAELREILAEAFELAPEGTEYVIWKPELRSGIQGPRGWQNGNHLRGRFNHSLQSSEISQINKPFQSMRSSRENEMVEDYPLKCVVDWVGHDIKVAAKHYLDSSSEEYHQKAVLGQRKSGAKSGALDDFPIELLEAWPHLSEMVKGIIMGIVRHVRG